MNTPRHDIYAFIHKGLRALMAHALVRTGRLDVNDAAEVAEWSEEIQALLTICRHHLHNENTFVHAAIEARRPGTADAIAHDHQEHHATLAYLEGMLRVLPGDPAALRRLYLALSVFVAENFEHMQREETQLNAVLWDNFSDGEIREIEQRIVASHWPEEMQLALRWMLPHLSPGERSAMLGGMRAQAPAEAFAGVLGLVRPLLGRRDWTKLSQALGL
jgi:Hemerythrin HHE cation binding domain